MGECLSKCQNRELDDDKNNQNKSSYQLPVNDISKMKPSIIQSNNNTKRKVNKRFTTPNKAVKFKLEGDIIVVSPYVKKDILNFEEITDDNKNENDDKYNEYKSLDSNISGLNGEEEQLQNKDKKNDEINIDNKNPEISDIKDQLINNPYNKLNKDNKEEDLNKEYNNINEDGGNNKENQNNMKENYEKEVKKEEIKDTNIEDKNVIEEHIEKEKSEEKKNLENEKENQKNEGNIEKQRNEKIDKEIIQKGGKKEEEDEEEEEEEEDDE